MGLAVLLKGLIIIEVFLPALGWHGLVQRRHGDIDMAFINQLRHKPVEKCQKKGADMRTIHIGIGHNDNLVVAQLADVKVVAVSF